ncbi:MAG TPA: RHS repeat-associated core domain-containing protein, partial [Kofleriaceae bacterium]
SGGVIQRTFTYDTLGRLVSSSDPDLGTHQFAWDDGDRLTREQNGTSQTVEYRYDQLGRLMTRDSSGFIAQLHYDAPRIGAPANQSGRLAWIAEPTGELDVGYDELGNQVSSTRSIDGHSASVSATYATSGLVLQRTFDDGLALTYQYDPAGRATGIGSYWQALALDANGSSLDERAGNGAETVYHRDILGQVDRMTLRNGAATTVYDVAATRDPANRLTRLTDTDGKGLDHSATFTYDGFSRLVGSTLGSGADLFSFTYQYDVLHNMTGRTQVGPRVLNLFAGTYRYGEGGHGPRQLTSIVDSANHVTHTFGYDLAGREVAHDGISLDYDASDRLVSVAGLAGGAETHTYGVDGTREKTIAADGTIAYYFGDAGVERLGAREHDIVVNGRVVARVSVSLAAAPASSKTAGVVAVGGFGLAALLGLALALARPRRRAPRWAHASAFVLMFGCASTEGSREQELVGAATVTYMHTAYGAGPTLYSDSSGNVIEERRYEPFGVVVDAANVALLDVSELGKRVDLATGWSDHGARWLAPETARWLSTDPPVTGPDAKFMAEPWALHPYQYVDQNPVAFWDPDG